MANTTLRTLLLIVFSRVDCHEKLCKDVDFWVDCSAGKTVDASGPCFCSTNSPNLTKLRIIGGGDLKSLPEGLLGNLKKLTKLVIIRNDQLKRLPEGLLKNLTDLEELDIQQNSLSMAPSVGHLTKLMELTLAYNPSVKNLPENYLKNNTNLTLFKATEIGLSQVPKGLFKTATQLRILHLDRNEIIALSKDTFQNLASLRTLNLAGNRLSLLAATIFEDLQSLRYLDLSKNNLTSEIVETLYPISSNLKELALSSNRLERFELAWSKNFSAMTKLLLDRNQISGTITEEHLGFAQKVTVNLENNVKVRVILDFPMCDDLPRVKLQLSESNIYNDCFKTKLKDDLKEARGRCIEIPGSETWRPGVQVCDFPLEDLLPDTCTNGCKCSFNVSSKESLVDCSNSGKISFDSHIPHVNNKTSSILLVLKGNGITDLETIFRGVRLNILNKIKLLDLSENLISRVEVSTLPPNLTHLYLNNNLLSGITDEVIVFFKKNMTGEDSVKLGGNKFSCDCHSVKLIRFLQEHSSKVSDSSEISFDCDPSEPYSEEGGKTEGVVCTKLGIYFLLTTVILCLLLLCAVLVILRKKEMIRFRVRALNSSFRLNALATRRRLAGSYIIYSILEI